MTSLPLPRSRPLRSFLMAMGVLVVGLGIFIFGVSMEATATAHGTIAARGEREARSPAAGFVDWDRPPTPGDEVKPEQVLATVRTGMTSAAIATPKGASLWLIVAVHVGPGQHVEAGQGLMTLVPLDPATHRPRELLAQLDVPEEHVADLETGQTVRLTSNLYNERLHGTFEAVIERIEPQGHLGDNGKRSFHVIAVVKDTPLRLLLGSSVKAEIIIGKKRVWRIILEH